LGFFHWKEGEKRVTDCSNTQRRKDRPRVNLHMKRTSPGGGGRGDEIGPLKLFYKGLMKEPGRASAGRKWGGCWWQKGGENGWKEFTVMLLGTQHGGRVDDEGDENRFKRG